MNIGIFSGSFNPIHIGHVVLGNYITEFTDIDEVWYLVSPHNPLKEEKGLLNADLRLEMVKIALNSYSKLKASDFEFSLPKPSYTITTLEVLKEQYPEHTFTLIIGADNWDTFEKWNSFSKILENYKILVYPRLHHRISIPSSLKNKVEALESPILEISSTFIRESIASEHDMKSLLPSGVYEYIEANFLYK